MTGLICVWQPEPRETHPAVPARVRGDTPSACSCGAGCRQGQHGALAENDEVDERPVIVNLPAQHAGDAAPRQSGSKFVCLTGWQMMVNRASLAIWSLLPRSPEVAQMKILGGFMTG